MQNRFSDYGEKMSYRKSGIGKYVLFGSLALLALVLLLFVHAWIQIGADGNQKETNLSNEGRKAQQALSQYYVDGANAIHLANSNTEALDKIMRDVVVGRYGGPSQLAQPNNGVYVALQQAYPNLGTVTQLYQEAENVLIGKFDNWGEENTLLWQARGDFLVWLNDPVGGVFARAEGYPNSLLEFAGKSGQAALDEMGTVVLDPQTRSSYQNGTLEPQAFPTP